MKYRESLCGTHCLNIVGFPSLVLHLGSRRNLFSLVDLNINLLISNFISDKLSDTRIVHYWQFSKTRAFVVSAQKSVECLSEGVREGAEGQ
jgi:hypothetical protein